MFVIVKVVSHGAELTGRLVLTHIDEENKKEGDLIWFRHPTITDAHSPGKIIIIPNKTEQEKLKSVQ